MFIFRFFNKKRNKNIRTFLHFLQDIIKVYMGDGSQFTIEPFYINVLKLQFQQRFGIHYSLKPSLENKD